MNTTEPTTSPGVADYYNRRPPKRATSRLVALAPHVLILARCEGAPEAARYFQETLGAKVTERMIKTIKNKVARGTLLVTREELEKAAMSHPTSAARLAREPSLCDPQHYRAANTPGSDDEDEHPPIVKRANNTAHKPPNKKAITTTETQPVKKPEVVEEQTPMISPQAKTPSTEQNKDFLTQDEVENIHRLLDADDEDDAKLYS
jgi:hypothetical protein